MGQHWKLHMEDLSAHQDAALGGRRPLGHRTSRMRLGRWRPHEPIASVLLPLILAGCATFPGSGRESLQDAIEGVIERPPLHQVHWGILIVDAEDGRTLFAHNPDQKFVPASDMNRNGHSYSSRCCGLTTA